MHAFMVTLQYVVTQYCAVCSFSHCVFSDIYAPDLDPIIVPPHVILPPIEIWGILGSLSQEKWNQTQKVDSAKEERVSF